MQPLLELKTQPWFRPVSLTLSKLQLAGQNLGRAFNNGRDCVLAVKLLCSEAKLPNLKLKTMHKQPTGYLTLDIVLLSPC